MAVTETSSGWETWGARVRAARLSKDWTLHELAQRSGLREVSLYRIETARRCPSEDSKVAIANALEVPINELFAYPKQQAS